MSTTNKILVLIIVAIATIFLCDFYLDNSGKILGKIMNFLNKKIN